ncbi:rhomboid family intramembrane serine protease [Maritimibacter sp. 55A14]|uniref:rhomboid family intramembrane serine protease n=1 Tax=Maritimibacter sp. 55A14 TaxID=2174844 RepID=UPI000D6156AA|nr:rhomboid family intramembrane serine protease [Maritimibacter sp. 55A14]PWE33303.1 rhomboid family intramembrane serine protease [Maritimibacter sp. 55A14]
MIPIRDHNPSLTTPWVTWGLIAANVLVFLSYWPLFNDPPALMRFFHDWALMPARVSRGEAYHGLVTSMFLHGGLLHIAGNMLFLWIFGDNLEDMFGHAGFLAFYLASGVAAALAQYATAPFTTAPMVGASGAVAGVMGGYLLLYPRARVDVLIVIFFYVRILALPAWVMLGIWFAFQLISGLGATDATGGVAYWAHAGGFLVGLGLTLPVWIAHGGPRFWAAGAGAPPWPEARYRVGHTHIPRVPRRRR